MGHWEPAIGTDGEHWIDDDEPQGITPEGTAPGHKYVTGNVNAHCPQRTAEHTQREGRSTTVQDCDYDQDK